MFLLIIFAFIAGVVTILSPCILPVLPIVLASSITTGKRRPLGIIFGFILSFTFFTLFLSTLVKLTGISPDFLRLVAVLVIFSLGVSLFVPQFQLFLEKLVNIFSKVIPKNVPNQQSGFISGAITGVSLGLIWTPCVGPILASVITLALTDAVTLNAVLITFAYALGTSIPMFLILVFGRQLFQKVPWLTKATSKIQKIFGVVLVLVAIAILFNFDRKFQTFILEKFPNYGIGLTQFEDNAKIRNQLNKFRGVKDENTPSGRPMFELIPQNFPEAPEFIPGGSWINSEPLNISSLKGKVVLVDFWTYTCINCIRTLPYLRSWHEKYADKGLVIVGVHTPEFEFEKNIKNVKKAVEDFKLKYPIVQDNNYDTWNAYNNNYWPAKYFVDKNGRIRGSHFGEGAYDESEKLIQTLLAETGVEVKDMPIANEKYQIDTKTPELYLGFDRIAAVVSPEKIEKSKLTNFSPPEIIPNHSFAFVGDWVIEAERAMPKKGAELILNFEARNVFLVMRTSDGPVSIELVLDDKALEAGGSDVVNSQVTIDADRLYSLIELKEMGSHILKIKFIDEGAELYAFTFG